MGEARRIAFEQCVDGATRGSVEPSGKRLGGVYRQSGGTNLVETRECRLFVMGIAGTAKRAGDRHLKTSCVEGSTSVATIRLPWLLRLQTFQQSERISDTTRKKSDNLVIRNA